MNGAEIDAALSTFSIVVDKREQGTKRAIERYRAFGVPFSRATLNYGDYTFNLDLGLGVMLYDEEQTLFPKVVIERKMSLEELSQCLAQSRERFRAEFSRAREHGCKIYLLVEDGSLDDIMNGNYDTHLHPNAYFASLMSFVAEFDLHLLFCKHEHSSWVIKDILMREARKFLEGYDDGNNT